MKWLKRLVLFLLVVYGLPVGASALWWGFKQRPDSFRTAQWGASGVLPKAEKGKAVLYILAARTGGMKGAVSVHSWIVFKKAQEATYQRYDVVGWGKALRHNAYPADGYWYSNQPFIVKSLSGEEADNAIAKVEKAIARYGYGGVGDYTIWPGPNSNSFVATILRDVPEIGIVLPGNAIGRDYLGQGQFFAIDPDKRDVHFSLNGYGGLSFGQRSGVELNIAGLVAGIDFFPLGVKIPAIGRIGF